MPPASARAAAKTRGGGTVCHLALLYALGIQGYSSPARSVYAFRSRICAATCGISMRFTISPISSAPSPARALRVASSGMAVVGMWSMGSAKQYPRGAALIGQCEQIVERRASLCMRRAVFSGEGHVLQTPQKLIGTHSNGVESVHGLEQVFGGLEHLHAQVDVQDGYARLIEEIAHHGAARHVCGPVKADVDLPLEALAKKAVGNGAQVVDALANAHLNGTAAREAVAPA